MGPEAPLAYVDDLAQAITGTAKHVEDTLVDVAEFLITTLRKRGVNVGIKSVVIPAASTAVKNAVRRLKTKGICVTTAQAGRDLGLDNSVGRIRSVTTFRTRHLKAKSRGTT